MGLFVLMRKVFFFWGSVSFFGFIFVGLGFLECFCFSGVVGVSVFFIIFYGRRRIRGKVGRRFYIECYY